MTARDTIIIGADNNENLVALRTIFEDSYNLLEAYSSDQAMELLLKRRDAVAGVVVDVCREGREAAQLLSVMREEKLLREMPLMLVIDQTAGIGEEEALDLGASDVVMRPTTASIIRRRFQTLSELYGYRWNLEDLVTEQARVLYRSNEMMVAALSNIIEHRSLESGQHVMRIRDFTRILLEDMSERWPEYELTNELIGIISSASALHDIGKISVPDAVLNKPGRLTAEEFEIIKAHTTNGSDMLQSLNGIADEMYLYYAYNICRYHHERWDGNGYPDGLEGDGIPICAQAVGLADVYDALTTPRVYKAAFSAKKAEEMILNGECGVFSPKVLESFRRVGDKFSDLAKSYADGLSPEIEPLMERSPEAEE